MHDTHTRVALLGFSGVGNAAASVSVARALRAGWHGDLELAALGFDPFMSGAWIPGLIDRFHLLAEGYRDGEPLIDQILELDAEHCFDALIVCEHARVPAIAGFAERLAESGLRALVPRSDRIAAVARPRMAAFLHGHDLPTPHTLFVPSRHDVAACAEQLGFPLWVKGPLRGAAKIHSAEQACDAAERLCANGEQGVLLQRTVEGETFDVAMVITRDGRCVGRVATRRLAVNDEGQVVSGAVVDDPQIDAIASRVQERLEWRGALTIELARANRGKQLYVCDLRARLPAWSMLTHWSGCNLPVRLLDTLLERGEYENTTARAGRIYVRGVSETAIPLDLLVRLDRRRQAEGIVEAICSSPSPAPAPSTSSTRASAWRARCAARPTYRASTVSATGPSTPVSTSRGSSTLPFSFRWADRLPPSSSGCSRSTARIPSTSSCPASTVSCRSS
jgi:hypothetical protein